MTEVQSLSPPLPPGTTSPSPRQAARWLGQNAIGIFTPEAYDEEVVERRMFGRRQIILNRPAAIQHILVDNWANYRRTAAGIRILRPLLGGGLLLSTGDDWRQQRRTLAPEIAGTSMFSLEMAAFGRELRALVRHYAARLGRPNMLDFLLPLWLPSPRDLRRWGFRRRWLGLIRRMIAARRAKSSTAAPRDLFDLMAGATDPESGALFPPAKLADEVATMIVAGHETTAVALFWSLYLLAETPSVQERLADEVAGLSLGAESAAALLPALVYTRAVVHEALRLYPPAFTLARLAVADDVAGGVAIPARAVVLIAPWVLHRHRRLWAQPERFDPSRFLPGAPPPDRFAYLPFGAGPRVCIGAQFALTEATLVLASLVQAFRIARVDAAPVGVRAIVTAQPDPPPLFRLTRR